MKTPAELLEDAVARLESAKSVTDVRDAHYLARVAIRSKRKASSSALAESLLQALDQWDDQKAAGVSFEDRAMYLERTVRAAWPQGRPWKYLCDGCNDLGWVFLTCSGTSHCGRPFRLDGAHTDDFTGKGRCQPGHSFARACGQCEKGRTYEANLTQQRRRSDDLANVGKSKDRGFSQVGRR